MRVIDCEQGGARWLEVRRGLPTASQYHRIITPKKLEFSAAVDGYRNEILAEELLGHPLGDDVSAFMERGTTLEADAINYYEFRRNTPVQRVGFCLRDDGRTGCSPDGLVGVDGGLEIKTPSAPNHVGFMIDGLEDKHRCQVQGCLYITGRQWWDVLSFNPELEPVLFRVERDEAFIGKLAPLVDRFIAFVDESRDKLIDRGFIRRALRVA